MALTAGKIIKASDDTHGVDSALTEAAGNVSCSGTLSATNLSGTNTGDQTSVSGNAGTATALATSRAIDGQGFDGTANITVIAPGTAAATSKATPVDADQLPLVDSEAANVLKKLTWTNLKATLKTYFDTLYNSTISFGTGVLTALGVNVGSAGSVVVNGGALGTPASGTLTNCTGLPTAGISDAASIATASVAMKRDASANVAANNFLEGYTTTATAAGTTTLTVASTYWQVFTGSAAQNCDLPVASTLALGQAFQIVNAQTFGGITVRSSGGNTVVSVLAGQTAIVICVLTSGTTAASWLVIPGVATTWSLASLYISSLVVSSGTSTFNQCQIGAGFGYYWSGRSCTKSPVDGVVTTARNDDTTPGWFQNSAGNSRVTTSDITNVTTTLANITGLSFITLAGRKYTAGKILLFVENVTAADGIKLDLDGGTGTWTSFRATYKVYDTSQAGPIASGTVTAIATDITVATVTGAAWVEIEFAGVANAAGTFIPRFAKNSDAAGAALTCRIDSNMTVQDCP
jgi:hypothetical protein